MSQTPTPHPGPIARLRSGWRALPALARAILADGLLPVGLMLAGTLWLSGPVARSPGAVVSQKLTSLQPIDYGATVWFYDWVATALARGAPILEPDTVCAPTGTTLGANFPNWADAILAAPLMGPLPFPTGYNLWLALIPVLGGLAAYGALRCLTERRSLALLGAWLFGFNAYSAYEVAMGRPSMALLAVLPLFLAAWLKATGSRGPRVVAWSLGAGMLAGLALHFYVLYALLAWLVGGLLWLSRLVLPVPGRSRGWLLLAAAVALIAAGLTTAPYLYQATALQLRFPAPSAQAVTAGADGMVPPWTAGSRMPVQQRPLMPWEPELWAFTAAFARDRLQHLGETSQPAPGVLEASLDAIARHSLPASFPWRGAEVRGDPNGLLPLPWLAPLVLLLALVAGPRTWPWASLCLLLWVLTLGPWLMGIEGLHTTPQLVEGQRLRLPLWYLVQALPEAGSFLKPARLFPGFLLALVLTLTVATDRLASRSRAWLERLWTPAARWLWPALAGLLILVSGFAQARVVRDLDDTVPFEPWAFHQQLALDPEPGAIIELPMGLGQAMAGFQAIHGRPRADDHHDSLAAQQQGEPAPTDCYRLGLLRALWTLGRDPAGPTVLSERDLTQAHQAGFRWVLVYPEAYAPLRSQGLDYDLDTVLVVLEGALGPPIAQDDHLIVYRLPTPSSGQQ